MVKLEDIDTIIEKTNNLGFKTDYDELCKNLYLCSDNINGTLKHLNKIQKALVPVGTGDIPVELASKGIDVCAYDINLLSYFPLELKIATKSKLDYETFINYWFGIGPKSLFADTIYWDFRSALSEPAQKFFDEMYDKNYPVGVFEKLFFESYSRVITYAHKYLEKAQKNISYYNELEFNETKQSDIRSRIKFAQTNILDLENSEFKYERDLDLVFLSNILYFLNDEEKEIFYNLMKTYYREILSKNGAIVNVFHGISGMIKMGSSQMDYMIKRAEELSALNMISYETHSTGVGTNELGNYDTDIIHVLRK